LDDLFLNLFRTQLQLHFQIAMCNTCSLPEMF